ncbi:MAG: gamma-glutamyltransferase family protein [Tepidisphaeraceae bacterium]
MPDFSFDLAYPSQRAPVLALNVVATSQPLAAQAGLRMLLAGGNAVDAAVACAIALTVVEPTSNGIGADVFAIVWDGTKLHGLNASGRSPGGWTREFFSQFEEMPARGWHSVTVPGAVSAWVELSARFGKLPLAQLFEPAIDYAANGYLVSPITSVAWQRAVDVFAGAEFASFRQTFAPHGRAPRAGELFSVADHAKSLEEIARTRGESFYHGDLAEKIGSHARECGGLLAESDLAAHRCDWVEPISVGYRDATLHEIPPNGQGIAALVALGILEHFDLPGMPVDSPDALHLQIEATKLGLADAYAQVADADFMKVTARQLLDAARLKRLAGSIDRSRACESFPFEARHGGTVYLTAADASGMMVSFIQSNFRGFGSGVVVPGTGIAMQDRGCGFVLDSEHPNCVGPRKRPFHTIIPGFVTRNRKPLMSFGVMGGPMQAQGHVQMISRTFDFGQNPQAASDAPRWRADGGRIVSVERGFSDQVLDDLKSKGHDVRIAAAGEFGGAQLIYKLGDGYFAASDHRKDGQALGF